MKSKNEVKNQREGVRGAGVTLRGPASCLLAVQLGCFPVLAGGTDAERPVAKTTDPVLITMETELNRAKTDLAKSDPAPYFLSYAVHDQDVIVIAGSFGGLLTDSAVKRRSADVTMRVGSPELDNTHGQSRSSGMTSEMLPLDGNAEATSRVLWEMTDRAYKRAAPAFLNVKTNKIGRAHV